MAYGSITRISENPIGVFSGTLENLEKVGDILKFENQKGLEDLNRLDVVDYTDMGGGQAGSLIPNAKVNQRNLSTATKEVQEAFKVLVLAVAKDKNKADLIIKKY
jgi:hypothetical protein